jgi:erythromycin esterase-like protein
MRSTLVVLAVVALATVDACHSPPPPPPAPVPLTDSAFAALTWVQTHTDPAAVEDSVASAAERNALFALTAGARIIGFSELTEGTHEFPYAIRRALFTLADSGVRGLAIQASMADALEIDRYVRGGPGDLRTILKTLGSWRWETREFTALVEAMRAWNAAHPDKTVGFYGFEIPTGAHAVSVIEALPSSVVEPSLKTLLTQRYSCVALNEGAHWGLEGRKQDSTYWQACGPATKEAADSVHALRQRVGASSALAPELAFADQMARLIEHEVSVGLRHLSRQDANAEHVLFVANELGANARLVLWGGDVEMARLTLDKNTVQTAVALSQRIGASYRAIGFAFGDGTVRARVPSARAGSQTGLSNARVLPPLPGTYEDVFNRAGPAAFWFDARQLPTDMGGAWLKGPHPMRLITELYTANAPQLFQTAIELPANLDAVLFIKHVTAAR